MGLLVELEAITSVVSRASNREVFGLVEKDTALQHSAASVQRVQGLMLALLPRFQHPPPDQPDHCDHRLYYKVSASVSSVATGDSRRETE